MLFSYLGYVFNVDHKAFGDRSYIKALYKLHILEFKVRGNNGYNNIPFELPYIVGVNLASMKQYMDYKMGKNFTIPEGFLRILSIDDNIRDVGFGLEYLRLKLMELRGDIIKKEYHLSDKGYFGRFIRNAKHIIIYGNIEKDYILHIYFHNCELSQLLEEIIDESSDILYDKYMILVRGEKYKGKVYDIYLHKYNFISKDEILKEFKYKRAYGEIVGENIIYHYSPLAQYIEEKKMIFLDPSNISYDDALHLLTMEPMKIIFPQSEDLKYDRKKIKRCIKKNLSVDDIIEITRSIPSKYLIAAILYRMFHKDIIISFFQEFDEVDVLEDIKKIIKIYKPKYQDVDNVDKMEFMK